MRWGESIRSIWCIRCISIIPIAHMENISAPYPDLLNLISLPFPLNKESPVNLQVISSTIWLLCQVFMLPAIYPTQHFPRGSSLSPFVSSSSLSNSPPFISSVSLHILGIRGWFSPSFLVHTFILLTYIL